MSAKGIKGLFKHVCFRPQMALKSSYNLFLIAEYFVFQEEVYRQVFVPIYTPTQIKISTNEISNLER